MGEFTTSNKSEKDWYLNSSRAEPLVAQPDMFYRNFTYNALKDHLYHIDVDCVLFNKKGQIVAIREEIKGIDNVITPYKKDKLSEIAMRLGVPFYIVNWDKSRGVQVTDVFRDTTKFQTWQEHAIWLRDLKYSTPPNATPHSGCCDCSQCIPDLKT